MSQDDPIVFIVDDDAAIRDSLSILLESEQIRTEVHASAAEFLASFTPARPCCLVLDARLPSMSGIDLLDRLAQEKIELPVIMITGHGDTELIEAAIRRGVVECMEKPFRGEDILAAIRKAVSRN